MEESPSVTRIKAPTARHNLAQRVSAGYAGRASRAVGASLVSLSRTADPNPSLRSTCFESLFVLIWPMNFALISFPATAPASCLERYRRQPFRVSFQSHFNLQRPTLNPSSISPRICGLRTPCANRTRKFSPKPRVFNALRTLAKTIGDGHPSSTQATALFPTLLHTAATYLSSFQRLAHSLQQHPGYTSKRNQLPAFVRSPLRPPRFSAPLLYLFPVNSCPWTSASPQPTPQSKISKTA